MSTPYLLDYATVMDTLTKMDVRIAKDGKEARALMQTLDPADAKCEAYVETMAALGMLRNSLRLEAESLYRCMKPKEKESVKAPTW